VILGGPEPVSYAAEYLAAGADVVVVGEGEQTLAELIPLLHQPLTLT
jgi:anaerobic magnesium-protoporphyrin IX monomethyl ester cyclase